MLICWFLVFEYLYFHRCKCLVAMRQKPKKSPRVDSHTQIIERLTELRNYQYVAYLQRLAHSSHLVRLNIVDFFAAGLSQEVSQVDFVVYEMEGYLRAVSVDGSILVDKLT